MTAQGIVGISGIDTRALTRHLRSRGAMRCGIFTGDAVVGTEDMVAAVREIPDMAGLSLTDEVSTTETYTVPAQKSDRYPALSVAAVDLGIKANTPRSFAARGITTHVVPASVTLDEILALGVDGVFLSNGPGDPATADHAVALTREILERRIPLFGICFGNQILGRALGFGTYKLKFGHRGINQPVRRPPHRRDDGDQPEPRLRRRCSRRARTSRPSSAPSGSASPRSTTGSSKD